MNYIETIICAVVALITACGMLKAAVAVLHVLEMLHGTAMLG